MPPHVRCAGPWVVASALQLGAATTGSAQNPDLILSKAARDSILATYDNIVPIWGRKAIDALAEPLLGGNLGNVGVNYSLQKSVADPWNMILGASWDLSKRWQFHLETGFIGRVQVLAMSNYRFNW